MIRQIRWCARYDDEATALENGSRRESVFDVAGQTIAADVLEERIRVEDFDEFQIQLVAAHEDITRVIHDFRNGQPGSSAGRTKRFRGWRDSTNGSARNGREVREGRGRRLVR